MLLAGRLWDIETRKSPSGRRAHHAIDPQSQPVLFAVLSGYASGKYSYRSLSQELNAQGYCTSDGKPFTESSISTILNNRFYEGVVVYHRGQSDEAVITGAHEVPEEIRELCRVARTYVEIETRQGDVAHLLDSNVSTRSAVS